jgi:hypothetical protein
MPQIDRHVCAALTSSTAYRYTEPHEFTILKCFCLVVASHRNSRTAFCCRTPSSLCHCECNTQQLFAYAGTVAVLFLDILWLHLVPHPSTLHMTTTGKQVPRTSLHLLVRLPSCVVFLSLLCLFAVMDPAVSRLKQRRHHQTAVPCTGCSLAGIPVVDVADADCYSIEFDVNQDSIGDEAGSVRLALELLLSDSTVAQLEGLEITQQNLETDTWLAAFIRSGKSTAMR